MQQMMQQQRSNTTETTTTTTTTISDDSFSFKDFSKKDKVVKQKKRVTFIEDAEVPLYVPQPPVPSWPAAAATKQHYHHHHVVGGNHVVVGTVGTVCYWEQIWWTNQFWIEICLITSLFLTASKYVSKLNWIWLESISILLMSEKIASPIKAIAHPAMSLPIYQLKQFITNWSLYPSWIGTWNITEGIGPDQKERNDFGTSLVNRNQVAETILEFVYRFPFCLINLGH